MTDRELMQMALDAIESAIKSGDWKVDGACDPEIVIVRLRERLSRRRHVSYVCPQCLYSMETTERLRQPEEVPCKTHPDAPHGFDRNASLSEDRYVCECEYWEPPVHDSDISPERVDETAKDKHEDWYGQHQWRCGYERGWDKAMEAKRERLSQPEPEPVAWADKHDIEREGHDFYANRQQPAKNGVPLYTAPPSQPEDDLEQAIKKGTKAWEGVDPTKFVEELRGEPDPKPSAWLDTEDWFVSIEPPWADYEEPDPKQLERVVPLYRSQPKREWVGLTEEDFENNVSIEIGVNGSVFNSRKFAKQIEQILKEKNHAD